MKPRRLPAVSLILLAAAASLPQAGATNYYFTRTTAGTTTWSSGTGWSAVPAGAADTAIIFGSSDGITPISLGSAALTTTLSAAFTLNKLDFLYSGPTSGSGTPSLTISGGSLNFVSNSGTTPVLTINSALAGTGTTRATLTISSAVTLTNDLTVAGSSTGTISGIVSGAGKLTKTQGGNLVLSAANTFTGGVTISGGAITISSISNIGSASGIGTGNSGANAGSLVLDGGTLRYTATGAGSTNRLFTLTAAGGALDVGGAGGFTLNNTAAIAFSGSGARTLTLNTSAGVGTLASIIGDGTGGATSVTKTGTGFWNLTGANTYTGTTTVSGGVLRVFGNPLAGGNLVLNGGAIELDSGTFTRALGTGANEVSLSGGGSAGFGARTNDLVVNIGGGTSLTWGGGNFAIGTLLLNTSGSSGAITFANNINLSGGAASVTRTVSVGLGGATLSGVISDSATSNRATLTLNSSVGGDNHYYLTNTNTYGGRTIIANTAGGTGTLHISRDNNLGTAPTSATADHLILAAGGILEATETFTLASNRGIGIGTTNAGTDGQYTGTISVAAGKTLTYGGVIANRMASVTGNNVGTLQKTGTGSLLLSGTSTYTGATIVSAGTLIVNGNIAGSTNKVGIVTVASGATLAGNGTLGGDTTISGTHSVGNSSIDEQTFAGDLIYASGSTFSWQLGSETTSGAGTNFDAVTVGGDLSVQGGTFNIVVNNLNLDSSFWSTSKSWNVFAVTGEKTGTFTTFNLFNASDTLTAINYGGRGAFTYSGGSLNWVVPEPSNALAGLLIAAGLIRRRRAN